MCVYVCVLNTLVKMHPANGMFISFLDGDRQWQDREIINLASRFIYMLLHSTPYWSILLFEVKHEWNFEIKLHLIKFTLFYGNALGFSYPKIFQTCRLCLQSIQHSQTVQALITGGIFFDLFIHPWLYKCQHHPSCVALNDTHELGGCHVYWWLKHAILSSNTKVHLFPWPHHAQIC